MIVPRVAMVLNTIGFGGVPEVAFQLLRHLPRDRFELRLCVLKGERGKDPARSERECRFERLGVPVHYGTVRGGKLDAVAGVADWLARERIDLLHTHSYRPNVYGRLAGLLCRASGLRIIAHYHNTYDDKWDRDATMLTLERRLSGSCDAMIAVSGAVRGHIASRLGIAPDRLDVVPNGVEPAALRGVERAVARSALGIGEGEIVAGLVGRVCEQKGQEDFVAAAQRLCERHAGLHFLMIGDIEDEKLHARLTRRIAAAGTDQRIRFAGHRNDMAAVYAALDMLVAPSRWEGFGLMLIEAMAAGIPIVASDVGAIPEVVGDDGIALLVAPRDPAALADAIERLAFDAVRRNKMSAAGYLRQARFTWQASAERVAAIYDRVLSARRTRAPCD